MGLSFSSFFSHFSFLFSRLLLYACFVTSMLKRYPCPIFCYRNQWSSLSISMSTKNRRYVCAHVTKMTQLIPYCSKFLRDKIFVLFVKGHLIFFTKFLPCCGCNIFYFEIIITNLIPFMKILTLENLELYGTYNIVVAKCVGNHVKYVHKSRNT